ncbi:UNVERIFIED_CONTAM: hypothetical protein FKN15_020715 [Acipenser sinensis]
MTMRGAAAAGGDEGPSTLYSIVFTSRNTPIPSRTVRTGSCIKGSRSCVSVNKGNKTPEPWTNTRACKSI